MKVGSRFFVRHICEGVAYYPEMKKMLLVREETLRKMDPTMSGVPLVFNTEHLTLKEGDQIAKAERVGGLIEGMVIRSFFNENDGRHWCEFMSWDDNAIAAIKAGIGVSNAYVINSKAPGGEYHAVEYDFEVMDAEYDHLLLTDSPRYEEARPILTPEQFKAYNESCKEKLALVTNSKEPSMSLFERKPAEIKLEGVEWVGPKSKKSFLITNVLNAVDEEMKKEEDGEAMANMNHKVKVGNATMKLCDLMSEHGKLMEENMKLKNENAEWEKAADGNTAENEKTDEEKAKNAKEEEEKEKAKNAKDEEEKKEKAENMKRIQNKVERLKAGPARAGAVLMTNSRNGNGEFEQPVIRFKEDAVEDGLKHYGTLEN